MRLFIGLTLIIATIIAAIWIGLFVFFIGGIIQIINALQLPTVDAAIIAWGVVKIIAAFLIFSFVPFIIGFISITLKNL